jgi:GTPase-associated protein 1, N-terminal domain type 2/GTPase-associated protein 1, middle domain
MSHEIYYTSAPEGMKRGSSGFSTVAATEGISKGLLDRLETLSAYRHHFGVASGGAESGGATGQNPVSFAHWLLNVMGATYHVLSRVCDSGVDHTQRSNAFAHHLVVESAEMAAGGPAWLLEYPGVMESAWDGRVGSIVRRAALPAASAGADANGGICRAWGAVTGDPGWGGVLADLFVKTPAKPVCILFAPGQEVLPLLAETIALLPAAARWNVTFNTYFTSMPTSATCAWRCCLAGTPAAQVGLRYAANGVVIDLTDRSRLGALAEGPYVTFARTGEAPAVARTAPLARLAATPTAKTPVKTPQAPIVNTLPQEDEEELELADVQSEEHDGVMPAVVEAAAGARAGEQRLSRPLVRKRMAPVMKNADRALRAAEGDAAKAAARRRKQVMLLFVAALGAIGVGMILVMVAFRHTAPAELPPVPRTSSLPPVPTPGPPAVVVAPANPVTPEPAPAPIVNKSPDTVVVPAPVVVVPPPPPTPAVRIVPRFPAVVTLTSMMEEPASGQGIADFSQTIPLPQDTLDPGQRISGLRLHFPGGSTEVADSSNVTTFPYKDGFSGTVIATPGRKMGLPVVTLSWKDDTDSSDVLEMTLNVVRNAGIELNWKASSLVKRPEVVKLVYWLVENSAIDLQTQRGGGLQETGQQIAFKPFAPQPIRVDQDVAMLTIPAALPADATVVAPTDLPEGWSAKWYTDWAEKDAALRTAENATQVIKFQKATGVSTAAAWFTVRFEKFGRIENSLPAQLADATAQITGCESDLRALAAEIDEAKRVSGGKLPDTDSTRMMLKKQDDTTALLAAYKAAVAGYNDIQAFDIPLSLPNGVRLATVKFRRNP